MSLEAWGYIIYIICNYIDIYINIYYYPYRYGRPVVEDETSKATMISWEDADGQTGRRRQVWIGAGEVAAEAHE